MSIFSKRTIPLFLAGFLSVATLGFQATKEIVNVDNIPQTTLLSQIESRKPPLIIDVRSPAEYAAGHVPGAINIEFRQIKDRIQEIQQFQNSTVVIYCETGIRARFAESSLLEAGFQSVFHLEGHMSAWRDQDLPLEKSAIKK